MIIAGDETPKGRILAAAARQLGRHGLRKFTVVDVAADAGMTHPNIYRYFTSKTALLDALVASWLKPLEDRIETVVNATDPVPDKLERMVVAISRAYRAAKAEEPQLFAAFAAATTANRAVSRKHRTRMRRAFERVIDEGIGTGMIGLRDRAKAQACCSTRAGGSWIRRPSWRRPKRAFPSMDGSNGCSRPCCKGLAGARDND